MPDYDAIIKAVENDKPLPKNVIDIPNVKESHTSYINRMQELNERIAQLTELVNTGTKTIESLEETLKTVEKERDRLADQRREQEPKFERVEKGEIYFTITGELDIIRSIESGYNVDNNKYNVNNYFYTKERAEEVADKTRFSWNRGGLIFMFQFLVGTIIGGVIGAVTVCFIVAARDKDKE